ncbi:hypothetical protein P9112_004695 [Eukaryota sp. TZLM1-RC]
MLLRPPGFLEHINLSEYVPGSLVAASVHNFTVFSSPRPFIFSPGVTWLLGCNGSGKSSIIDAVGLCLGCEPNDVGRVTHQKDYVSFGSKEPAEINVYICKSAGSIVEIRRQIDPSKPNSRLFFKDRSPIRKEDLLTYLNQEFSINLSSLVQFTPQFKLEDLITKTGKDFLIQTQKLLQKSRTNLRRHRGTTRGDSESIVVARDPLSVYYELIEAELKISALQNEIDMKNAGIVNLEDDLRPLEQAAMRFNKKETLTFERDLLKIRLRTIDRQILSDHIQEYNLDLNKFDQEKSSLLVELNSRQDQCNGFGEREVALKQERENWSRRVSDRSRERSRVEGKLNTEKAKLSNIKNEIEKLSNDLSTLNHRKTEYLSQRTSAENELKTLEHELPQFGHVMSELDEGIATLKKSAEEINKSLVELGRNKSRITMNISDVDGKIQELSQSQNQRMNQLSRIPHLLPALRLRQLIDQNQDRFLEPVIGPLVTDVKFSRKQLKRRMHTSRLEKMDDNLFNHICKCVQIALAPFLTTFVVKNREDDENLTALMTQSNIRQKILSVGALTRDPNDELAFHNPNCPSPLSEEFVKSPFFCYGLDVLKAPPEVLQALIDFSDVDQVLIGGNDADSYVHQTSGFVFDSSRRISRVFSAQNQHSIDHNRFSSSTFSTIPLHGTALLFDVDSEVHAQELMRLKQAKAQMVQEHEEITKQELGKNGEKTELMRELRVLMDEKRELVNKINSKERLSQTIERNTLKLSQLSDENLTSKLQQLEQALPSQDELVRGLEAEFQEVCEELTRDKGALNDLNNQLSELNNKSVAESSELEEMKHHIIFLDRSIKELQQRISRTQRLISKCQEDLSELTVAFQERYNDVDLEAKLSELSDDVAEVKSLIENKDTMIQRIADVNPQELRNYDAKRRQLEKENLELEGLNQNLSNIHHDYTVKKGQWQNSIKDDIEKLSTTFANHFHSMDLQGAINFSCEQVQTAALDILCAFRRDARLSPLNMTIQSGGERALSIITFLLSLQCIAKCPFRIVDEINRGLDSLNEHSVMNLVVQDSSERDHPQFIVSSPKILDKVPVADDTVITIMMTLPSSLNQINL